MDFFFLLLLTIPIFYILGIITCIKTIIDSIKKNTPEIKKDSPEYLKTVLPELITIAQKYPKKTVAELVIDYKKQLKEFLQEDTVPTLFQEPARTKRRITHADPLTINWQNWINNNSINLLLYLGAFLIVAAASIFVGFQWQTISGYVKADLLTLLVILFFGLGIWFYKLPKIRNAGATFIGIGALLLPICGAGWYNFVLKDMGIGIAPVWLMTSLIALLTYIFLATFLRNAFYTYIASLSTISFAFSFVNLYNLAPDFYILAAILSSFVLFLVSIVFKHITQEKQQFLTQPFSITANVTLPASLVYGLIFATNTNTLFTLASSISIFLAAGYYFLSYKVFKKTWLLVFGQILVSIGIGFVCQWQQVSDEVMIYLIIICSLGEILLGHFFSDRKTTEEAEAITLVAIIQITFVFLLSLTMNIDAVHLFFYTVGGILGGLFAYDIRKHIIYVGYSLLALTVNVYILHMNILHLENQPYILGIIYTGIGVGCYSMLVKYKHIQDYLQVFASATIFFFFLGIIGTISYTNYCLLVSLVIYGALLAGKYYFSDDKFVYCSNIFLNFSLWQLLQVLSIPYDYYPLAFSILYVSYYLISIIFNKYQRIYRLSSLWGLAATPAIFGFYSLAGNPFFDNGTLLERYALISGYTATVVYALDAVKYTSAKIGYTASAMGVLTYLWQISMLNITQTQIYTFPVSIYFFALAFLQNKAKNVTNRNTLNLCGIFFLLMPSLVQSFGENGITYSLIFGLEGIALLMGGITLKDKHFTYSGVFAIVFAVISQTYQYVFSIPRWVLVGSVGAIFLVFAIYLLMHRKDGGEKK